MRKINLLFLFLLGVPCLSFTSNDESFFSLNSFELEFSEDNKKITVINRYTSTVSSYSVGVELNWRIKKDDEDEEPLDHITLNSMKKVTNEILPVKPTIDVSTLGEENEIILYARPSDTKVYIRESVHVNLKGKPQVTFKEKDNDIGVSSGYKIESKSKCDESKNYVKEDRVIFSNYEDLVVEDYYLNFDIERFKYSYVGNKDILEGEFNLLIYDKYNLFKDLPLYKDSQYRYIELKPNVINGDSVFSFKENIYYDPVTHNPSTTYLEGYKETNKLYFPVGKLNTLKSVHCMLNFNINGYTDFNMSSEFDIYFLRNYFGDCVDSEYCVEINSDSGKNIREKVVDVNL